MCAVATFCNALTNNCFTCTCITVFFKSGNHGACSELFDVAECSVESQKNKVICRNYRWFLFYFSTAAYISSISSCRATI